MKSSPVTPATLPRLREALLDHYDRTARDLPWRKDTDPYRVMVSEFMLQQTRVETVKGYYGRWLEQFPTVSDLAAADESEVLKAWEGLGYYRRARNLHGAARVVHERFAGQLPATCEALRELPGIGEYTAGAVASIAFDEPVPAVDGNVRRVLARLFDRPAPTAAWLRERAAALVDHERPGDWNQAVMELGATVCTPRTPDCDECPVSPWCAARAAGTVDQRPAAKRKRTIPAATIVLCVLHRDGEVLLERRAEGGLLGGMWAFPEEPLQADEDVSAAARRRAHGLVESGVGVRGPLAEATPLGEVRHRFSHLDARYHPVAMAAAVAGAGVAETAPGPDLRWVTPARATAELALPVAQQKVLAAWVEHRARTAEPTSVAPESA